MKSQASARRRLLSAALLLPIVVLSSCVIISCIIVDSDGEHHWFRHSKRGSGHRIEETRSVSSFSRVEFDLAGDVVVHVGGESTALVLSGDDDVLPHVVTRVEGETLHIYLDRDYKFEAGLRVRIETPSLASFDVDGAGDIRIHGVSGDEFRASIDGAGDIHADGNVRALHASIDGAGGMSLGDLRAETAVVSIDGAGNIRVSVDKELRYSIDGAGNIVYDGQPGVSGAIDGAGSVTRRTR